MADQGGDMVKGLSIALVIFIGGTIYFYAQSSQLEACLLRANDTITEAASGAETVQSSDDAKNVSDILLEEDVKECKKVF